MTVRKLDVGEFVSHWASHTDLTEAAKLVAEIADILPRYTVADALGALFATAVELAIDGPKRDGKSPLLLPGRAATGLSAILEEIVKGYLRDRGVLDMPTEPS